MRELCELLENITEEGYTVLFGQNDGSDELCPSRFRGQ